MSLLVSLTGKSATYWFHCTYTKDSSETVELVIDDDYAASVPCEQAARPRHASDPRAHNAKNLYIFHDRLYFRHLYPESE